MSSAKPLELTMGSITVKFYPLTLAIMQELEDELSVITSPRKEGENYFSKERIAKMMRVYVASAKRGDPAITEDDVKRVVDIQNVIELNLAVLGRTKKEVAEAAANAPEGAAQIPTSPLTGGESTQG